MGLLPTSRRIWTHSVWATHPYVLAYWCWSCMVASLSLDPVYRIGAEAHWSLASCQTADKHEHIYSFPQTTTTNSQLTTFMVVVQRQLSTPPYSCMTYAVSFMSFIGSYLSLLWQPFRLQWYLRPAGSSTRRTQNVDWRIGELKLIRTVLITIDGQISSIHIFVGI